MAKVINQPSTVGTSTDETVAISQDRGVSRQYSAEHDQSAVHTSSSLSIPSHGMPEAHIIQIYIDAFFHFVYPTITCNFIHKSIFLRCWNARTVNTHLLQAVCTLAVPFVLSNESISKQSTELVNSWVKKLEQDIGQDFDDLSYNRLQVLMLLASHRFVSSTSGAVWMLSALASRLAYGLQFNYEDKVPRILMQESRRRLMWAAFIMDKWQAGGIKELVLCPTETVHVNLPGDERCFALEIDAAMPSLQAALAQPPANMGVEAFTVLIMDRCDRILQCTKEIIRNKRSLWSCQNDIESLRDDLERIYTALPAELRRTKANVSLHAFTPDLTRFITMHTWWLQCHCDLYRLTIPGIQESVSHEALRQVPTAFASECRQRCLDGAVKLCQLWATVRKLGSGNNLTDPSIATCAYQIVKILARFRGLDNPYGDAKLSEYTMECLVVLRELAKYYPRVAILHDDVTQFLREEELNASRQSQPFDSQPETPVDTSLKPPPRLLARHHPLQNASNLHKEQDSNSTSPAASPIVAPMLHIQEDPRTTMACPPSTQKDHTLAPAEASLMSDDIQEFDPDAWMSEQQDILQLYTADTMVDPWNHIDNIWSTSFFTANLENEL